MLLFYSFAMALPANANIPSYSGFNSKIKGFIPNCQIPIRFLLNFDVVALSILRVPFEMRADWYLRDFCL